MTPASDDADSSSGPDSEPWVSRTLGGASSSSAYAAATPPTIDYLERRVSAGDSKRDAIRCLKRYLARELYNDIQAIIATTQPPPQIAA